MARNSGQPRRNNHPNSVKLLQRLENGLDAFMDASVDAFLLFDDNLDLMSINPAGERLFGVSKEMVVGKNIVELEPGIKETGKYDKYLDVMKTGELFFVEEPFSHPKFGDMHLSIKAFKMRKGLGMIVNDITERRQMEEALRESELLAIATIEGMSDGVVLVGMDGKVAYINKAFEKMLGYKLEELVGTSAVELPTYHGSKDRKKARQALKMVIEKGSAEPIDMVALTKDGVEIPINFTASVVRDAEGNPKTLVAVIRDVTERKKAEDALRRSEEHFRALVENSHEAIVVLKGDGTISFGTTAVERMLGYTSEDLLGRGGFGFAHPDDMPKVMESFTHLMANPSSVVHVELRIQHKDGSWRIVEAVARNLLENKAVEGIVINWRDITERKKAEEELRESEAKLKLYLDNSPDAIYILDAMGDFLYGNIAAEKAVGYSREEILGRSFVELSLLSDVQLLKAAQLHELNLAGKPTGPQEYELTRKDGSRVFVEISTYPVGKGDNLEVIGIARDITERRRMEEALRESELLATATIEGMSDGVVLVGMDGKVAYVNKAFEKMLGYKIEELVGTSAVELPTYHGSKDKKKARQGLKMVIEKGSAEPIDMIALSKDGMEIPINFTASVVKDAKGNPKTLVAVIRDVTERRWAEEALRESEKRLSDIAENSQEWIWEVDTKGKYTYSSPIVESILGYTSEEILEKHFYDLFHPDDRENLKQVALEAFARKESFHELVNRNVSKDGKTVWLSTSGIPLLDNAGNLMGYRGSDVDITERKKAEEALKESEERYRRLVDNAQDIIFRFSADKGLEYVSPAVSTIMGYSAEELRGNPELAFGLATAKDEKLAKDYQEVISEGKSMRTRDITAIRKDGKQVYLDMRSQAVRDKDGNVVAFEGILRDITERRKMEEEVRLLSDAVRMTTDSVAIADMRGRILDINEAGLRMYGLSDRADFVGKNPLDAIAPEDRSKAIENMAKIMETGQVNNIEYHVLRKDGSRILIETSVSVIRGGNGEPKGLVAVARDITERKRAGEALRQSEKKYRQLFEIMQEGLWLIDKDSITTFVNPRMAEILGYTAEEMLGKHLFEFMDERGIEVAKYNLERRSQGIKEQYDFEFTRKDGARVYASLETSPIVDEEGNYIGALACVADITGRKQAEDALRLSEERYRLVVDNANEAIVVAQNGMPKFLNSRAIGMLGYSKEEITSKPFIKLVHPDDQQMVAGRYMARLRGEELPAIYSFRVVDKAGNFRWVEINTVVINWEGRPATLNFLTDITERKKAEEEKQRMEEQLRLAGRLAVVGELAAGVAHELNNPLAAIQGYSQFLASSSNLDVDTRKDVETIYREALRASKITQNLLSFARRHEPEKKFISLNEVIENTVELRAHPLKVGNIELRAELDPDLPKTMADFYQLQQVFVNIINNAEQAMAAAHGKGKLVIKTQKSNGMIQVTFTDDGPGISEENLKRIFDPFFTTKEVGKGTGLGLSICYGIVEAHGGRVYAKSKLGTGASFIVEIPILIDAESK